MNLFGNIHFAAGFIFVLITFHVCSTAEGQALTEHLRFECSDVVCRGKRLLNGGVADSGLDCSLFTVGYVSISLYVICVLS